MSGRTTLPILACALFLTLTARAQETLNTPLEVEALAAIEAGQPEQAIALLEREPYPRAGLFHAFRLYHRARAYEMLGQKAEAARVRAQLFEEHPRTPYAPGDDSELSPEQRAHFVATADEAVLQRARDGYWSDLGRAVTEAIRATGSALPLLGAVQKKATFFEVRVVADEDIEGRGARYDPVSKEIRIARRMVAMSADRPRLADRQAFVAELIAAVWSTHRHQIDGHVPGDEDLVGQMARVDIYLRTRLRDGSIEPAEATERWQELLPAGADGPGMTSSIGLGRFGG